MHLQALWFGMFRKFDKCIAEVAVSLILLDLYHTGWFEICITSVGVGRMDAFAGFVV